MHFAASTVIGIAFVLANGVFGFIPRASAPSSTSNSHSSRQCAFNPECCTQKGIASAMPFWPNLLDTTDFPPRWRCGTWSEPHGWLHIISDIVIWLAYLAIPCALVYFIRRRRDLPYPSIFWLFCGFIVACGTTHLFEALMFWWPTYRLMGLVKFSTAVISGATVAVLIPVIPKALALRSPADLAREVEERRKVEEELRRTKDEQEQHILERTADLKRVNQQLEAEIEEHGSTERALRESEERTSLIIDNALDAVISIDSDGLITAWNKQAEKTFGWDREEVIGKQLSEIIMPARYARAHEAGLKRFFATGEGPVLNTRVEVSALNRSGEEFPVELAVTPVRLGPSVFFSAFIRDISERKRSEAQLKEKNAQLERAKLRLEETAQALQASALDLKRINRELGQKVSELDEFSYVASHDLQEPLRKLIAFGQLLPRDLGHELTDLAKRDLDFIIEAAQRMQTLVQDLLELSRAGKNAMRQEQVSLDKCADQAIEALAARIEETGARISRDHLPDVVGDLVMLSQLYQNLISNALKFIPVGCRPEIHLTANHDGHAWTLGVKDNGIGIKPEYAKQIFMPFKRLHGRSEYEGSGIGLSICRKVVERHVGRIWVESEPDRGAHFKFTLGTCGGSEICETSNENVPSYS